MEPAGEAPSTHLLGGGLHHATPVHLAQLVHLAALPAAAGSGCCCCCWKRLPSALAAPLLAWNGGCRCGLRATHGKLALPLCVRSCDTMDNANRRCRCAHQPAEQSTSRRGLCGGRGRWRQRQRLLAAPCRSHSTRGRQPHAPEAQERLAWLSCGTAVTVGLHAARCRLSSDRTVHCNRDLGRGWPAVPPPPHAGRVAVLPRGSLKRSLLSRTAQRSRSSLIADHRCPGRPGLKSRQQ